MPAIQPCITPYNIQVATTEIDIDTPLKVIHIAGKMAIRPYTKPTSIPRITAFPLNIWRNLCQKYLSASATINGCIKYNQVRFSLDEKTGSKYCSAIFGKKEIEIYNAA